MDQIVPSTLQEQPDYLDDLLPGYRFSPTDSELILYFLKPKKETGKHPQCRIYEVNLYKYGPEELTKRYRACDDKWYFFTPRERKYQKGKVADRTTGDFGHWKTTQKYTSVYHHYATGSRVVGTRRSLAYYEKGCNEKSCKTLWLMQEYTTNEPNLPIGQGGNKVLTDWVLCKIYKHKSKETDNAIVQAPHQVVAREEVEPSSTNSTRKYQQNHSISMPSNNFQLPNGASASTSINPHVNGAQSCAYTSPNSDHIFKQRYSMSTATNNFCFSNGASRSTLCEPHVHAAQPPADTSLVTSTDMLLDGYEDISKQKRSTAVESIADVAQPSTYASPVAFEDVAMDEWDHLFQPDAFPTLPSVLDGDNMDFVVPDWISFEDLYP